ncbi:hypothetical protein ASG66_05845 [Bacillus sp. Leaf406]|nr:hypothetical protein ASG66_05845 [Bacillus sp. Leaf406]
MILFCLTYCFNNGEVYKQSTIIARINKKSQIKNGVVYLDVSQNPQKGKERLSGGFVLCLTGQTDQPPLFYMSSSGALRLEVIRQNPEKAKGAFPGFCLMLVASGRSPSAFL